MKFGPKRGNILIIFDSFIKNFGLLMLYLLMFFAVGPDVFKENLVFLVIALISPVARLISYLSTFYAIDDKSLIVSKGIFIKKRTEIPLSAITTVDMSQDILFQFFNVFKIKIDNASQTHDTADKAEAVFALSRDEAFFVKELLSNKSEKKEMEDIKNNPPFVKAPVKSFFLLGIMESKLIYLLAIAPLIGTISALVFSEEYDTGFIKIFNTAISTFGAAAVAAFGAVALYLITLIFNLIRSIITYMDFTVFNNGDSVSIEYGFLNKKKYTLKKSKINGIALRQTILMRLFKYCSVEVFVIGYGDKSNEDKNEESVLYPFIRLSEVPSLLAFVMPEFSLPQAVSKPGIKNLRYFFFSFYFIFAVIILAVFIILGNGLAIAGSFVLLLLALLAVYMEYKTTGISGNKDNITFITGIFNKRTTVVKTSSVESVSIISNILKIRKGVGHIKIGFLAPIRVSMDKVHNVNSEEYEKIKALIKY